MTNLVTLDVDRSALEQVRWDRSEGAALADGEARLAVEQFALTANNITYAVFGDMLRYWDFFPATAPWGRIPVWGFGRVVESRADGLAVGQQVYGYLPMSSELVVTPGRIDDRGFTDLAEHRSAMAAAYNRYGFTEADPVYRAGREAHQMVLYPLFFTSFVIDDYLADQADFGAGQLWVSSASAKTAIGVAFLAHQRGMATVGLTSERNRAFVEGLGVYDTVATYGEVPGLDAAAAVYVDIAGNADVSRSVHSLLDAHLGHSMQVGGTHWDHQAAPTAEPLPGPAPEFFFAPTQVAKRTHDWGQAELDARLGAAWDAYSTWVDGWLRFQRYEGAEQVEAAYRELLANQADPSIGHVCTLTDGAR